MYICNGKKDTWFSLQVDFQPEQYAHSFGQFPNDTLYDKIEKEMGMKKAKKLKFWQNVSLIYAPLFALGFMTVYWVAGLKHADVIQVVHTV